MPIGDPPNVNRFQIADYGFSCCRLRLKLKAFHRSAYCSGLLSLPVLVLVYKITAAAYKPKPLVYKTIRRTSPRRPAVSSALLAAHSKLSAMPSRLAKVHSGYWDMPARHFYMPPRLVYTPSRPPVNRADTLEVCAK